MAREFVVLIRREDEAEWTAQGAALERRDADAAATDLLARNRRHVVAVARIVRSARTAVTVVEDAIP